MPPIVTYYVALLFLGTTITFGVYHENLPSFHRLQKPIIFNLACLISGLSSFVLLIWGGARFGFGTAAIGLCIWFIGGLLLGRFLWTGHFLVSLAITFTVSGLGLGVFVYLLS